MTSTTLLNKSAQHQIPIFLQMPENRDKVNEICILCHGFASHSNRPSTTTIATIMLNNDIAALSFDFPCHGKSNANIMDFTVDNCINDLLIVIKYAQSISNISKISLYGVSFGGYIILNMLLKYNIDLNHIILRAPAIEMKNILLKSFVKMPVEAFEKIGAVSVGFQHKTTVPYHFYTNLCQYDLLKNISCLPYKILILHGIKDDIALIKHTRTFITPHPNIKLIEIPHIKHALCPTDLEKITKLVLHHITQKKLTPATQ